MWCRWGGGRNRGCEMPALENPRHERFAQLLAKGKTATEAYVEAGYRPNDGNAATLKGNQRVADRVSEIQERAATRVEISVASITESLLRIANKAEALAESSGLSVARAAQMDVAKLNGLVVDKSVRAETTLEDLLDGLPASEPAATSH